MNDDELDSLLAKGALSGPERDRVFERVWQTLQPSAKAARRRSVVAAGGVALVAAAAGLVAVVATRRPMSEFSARGGRVAETSVEVECTGGTRQACPRGSRLVFRSYTPGYLAAYAQPVLGGERIWYFSAGQDVPYVGAPSAPDRLADRVVVVGPEHALGAYDVHVLVGARPLSVAEALDPKSGAVVASGVVRLTVTP